MTTLRQICVLFLVGGLGAGCIDLPEIEYPATTDGGPDTVAPSVLGTVPADGANGVSLASRLEVNFSEPMRPSTVQVSLQPAAALGAVEWSAADSRLVVQPAATLAESTTYTLTVTGQDKAGNSLTGTRSFIFRTTGPTPDIAPPAVAGFAPGDAEMGVDRSGAIIVLFSEPMSKASVESAFAILSPLGFNSGTFTWNAAGTEMTYKPDSDFSYGTDARWRISTAAKDISGNSLQAEATGSFRVVNLYTVRIDYDPYTSGSLDKPRYLKLNDTYDSVRVGDTFDDHTHRLFLGFKLDILPESLKRITQANLKWWITNQQGDPFGKFGNLLLERVDVGVHLDGSPLEGDINPLAVADFHTPALSPPIIVPNDIAFAQNALDVTPFATQDWADRATLDHRTQFRLRFEGESDYNKTNDNLYSSAGTQPKLAELQLTFEAP